MKAAPTVFGLAVLLAAGACGTASNDASRPPVSPADSYPESERPSEQAVEPSAPLAPISDPAVSTSSPYRIELWHGDSGRLPTYYSAGRMYVLGTIGERYRIHIANPTSRRVEAVVSVDGLDAIDGRPATFQDKRGYVIAPHGEITVDGFRTSLDQVATFRFSSVRDSYAGQKGQDRNVGVIGVAFFPEREAPMQMIPQSPPSPPPYYDRPHSSRGSAPARKSAGVDAETASRAPSAAPSPTAPSAAAAPKGDAAGAYPGGARSEDRRGLGTEFGEQRHSSVGFTNFQRENAQQPSHVVELRYNDRQGLLALGIPVENDGRQESEVTRRETADPFPRSRFATPPPR